MRNQRPARSLSLRELSWSVSETLSGIAVPAMSAQCFEARPGFRRLFGKKRDSSSVALKNRELVAESQDLELQRGSCLERRGQAAKK